MGVSGTDFVAEIFSDLGFRAKLMSSENSVKWRVKLLFSPTAVVIKGENREII